MQLTLNEESYHRLLLKLIITRMGIGNCFGDAQIESQDYDDINMYIDKIKEKRKSSIKDRKHLSQNSFDYFSSTYENTQTAYASTCKSLINTIDTLYMTGEFNTKQIIIEDENQQFFYTANNKFNTRKRSVQYNLTQKFRKIQRSKSNEYSKI